LALPRIQAHDLDTQVVGAQQPTAQLLLEPLPGGAIPHALQEVSQAVRTSIQRADRFARQGFKQMQMLRGPFLKVRETVIPARKDEAQPTGNNFSGRKRALPVGVWRKVFVKEPDDSHGCQLLPQQRNVIDSLYPNDLKQFLDHALSLSAQGAF
jgi:hypothetical protein